MVSVRSWMILTLAWGIAAIPAWAEPSAVPNREFTEGTEQPTGWKLTGGQGRWVDRQFLELTGDGKDSNAWNGDVSLEPARLYRFEMRARRLNGGGTTTSGTNAVNHDFAVVGDWRWYGFVFRSPDQGTHEMLHLGQWQAAGTLQFDAVRLTPVVAVPYRVGELVLGDDESIRDGLYRFQAVFNHEGSNYHAPLVSANVRFNTDRWAFGSEQQITYRFGLPGHRFLTAEAGFSVNYYGSGGLTLEASRDGQTWLPVTSRDGLGEAKAALPAELLPADTLWIRIRSSKGTSGVQIARVLFQGRLSDPPADAAGKTFYAEEQSLSPQLALERATFSQDLHSGKMSVHAMIRNTTDRPTTVARKDSVVLPDGKKWDSTGLSQTVAAGATASWDVGLLGELPGKHRLTLRFQPAEGQPLECVCDLERPDYYRSDYGQLLTQVAGTSVWCCDATHKVPRQRAVPRETGQAAELAAARNDYEAVQVVVRPEQALRGLQASCSALKHAASAATIAAEEVQVLRAYYHRVESPSDDVGLIDWWPDALPPLAQPIDVAAADNQPLWILVHVPQDAKAGDYTGEVTLQAEGWSATVPLRLHVWDFALPVKSHLETAFGFDPGMACCYHNVKTEADQRKLGDLYLRTLAEHRIGVYNPTPFDPIRVEFLPEANPPQAKVDFTAFDRAMSEAIERYHVTNFMLSVQGMGGGTFFERWEPEILKFGEQTPQYQAMFASQLQQIESHLREKGWLSMAYAYWFDEPEPRDYAFVRNGMERIKRFAPGIPTMLTEEPNEALGGAVDIFCPLTPSFDAVTAEKLRAKGTRFWWYVCTAPKAPFCTLFLDHSASELRVWLWQTWQRKIQGILVWQSNYWHSPAAYPDQHQNPYEDPMSYVVGYGTPPGTRLPWGNGDGRFLYPALAAAVPGPDGAAPILDAPVSSIRLEMLREGVEDYEYLYLLRERLGAKRASLSAQQVQEYEALLEVPESITKDITTFTTDPAPIYQRRAAIAAAIEQLGK